MVGPNRWRDEGPGNGTRGQAFSAQPAIPGRNVGYMEPLGYTGPIVEARSDGTNKLGIAKRWNGAKR